MVFLRIMCLSLYTVSIRFGKEAFLVPEEIFRWNSVSQLAGGPLKNYLFSILIELQYLSELKIKKYFLNFLFVNIKCGFIDMLCFLVVLES
jgi:hypothetical protein